MIRIIFLNHLQWLGIYLYLHKLKHLTQMCACVCAHKEDIRTYFPRANMFKRSVQLLVQILVTKQYAKYIKLFQWRSPIKVTKQYAKYRRITT